MFWIILIVLFVLLAIAYGLGISFWGLIGILLLLALIFCIGCWLFDDGKEERAKLKTEEEKTAFDKKIKKRKLIGKIILIGVGVALVIVIFGGLLGSCDLLSSSSSSDYNDSYDSDYDYDYDNDYDYKGKYGHGSKYDSDVNSAADAFGEDPDHVNDVYEALAGEMR